MLCMIGIPALNENPQQPQVLKKKKKDSSHATICKTKKVVTSHTSHQCKKSKVQQGDLKTSTNITAECLIAIVG